MDPSAEPTGQTVIVGAGVGGLAAAHFLKKAGMECRIFERAGATVVYSGEEVGLRSQLLVRLSPPTPDECEGFQSGQVVISGWHLAVASHECFTKLLEGGVTTVGYEIIEQDDGHAPVLEAMSEIAGRLAVTIGADLLLNEFGGKGLLIGGAPGIPPASMVILGAGLAQLNLIRVAVLIQAGLHQLQLGLPPGCPPR